MMALALGISAGFKGLTILGTCRAGFDSRRDSAAAGVV